MIKFSDDYFLERFLLKHNFDFAIRTHDINHCNAGAPTSPVPLNTKLTLDGATISLPPQLDSDGIKALFNNEKALAILKELIKEDTKLREQFLLSKNEVLAGFLDTRRDYPKSHMFNTLSEPLGQPEEAIIPFFKDTLLLEYYRIHLQNILFKKNTKDGFFYPPLPAEYDQQIYTTMPLSQYPDNVAFICNDVPVGNAYEAVLEPEESGDKTHLLTKSPLIFYSNHRHFIFGDSITAVHLKPYICPEHQNLWQTLSQTEQLIEDRFWECPRKRLDIVGKGYSDKIESPYRKDVFYSGLLGPHTIFSAHSANVISSLSLSCADILEQPEDTLKLIQEKFRL
jgi:hypothetical protein